MDTQSLANIAEFVGAVAVVVSLIYIAREVRQGTDAQRMENFARALDRIAETQAGIGRNPELMKIWSRGFADPTKLTNAQRLQMTWLLYEAMGPFEFLFIADNKGALPPGVWQRWSGTLAWWVSYPGVQAWWRAKPYPFTDEFSRYVDQLIAQGVNDPQAETRWLDFVAPGRTHQVPPVAPG